MYNQYSSMNVNLTLRSPAMSQFPLRFSIPFIAISCFLLTTIFNNTQAEDYPYKVVPFTDVQVVDGFWGPRFETNRNVTVWYDFQRCEETGRIANFARAGGLEEGPFQGIHFNDSDVFKVIEGAAYLLAQKPDPKLEAYTDQVIDKIAAAQEEDGYLYTARTLKAKNQGLGPERWSPLSHSHELYNVGHMYEAAVAYKMATGKSKLFDVAIKNADLVCKVFGLGEGQLVDVPGHEEIEIGLMKLYHATGQTKYRDQAKFFVDMRGNKEKRQNIYGDYCQDHEKVIDQTEAVGHAVRSGYLYAAVADIAAVTGDTKYQKAIERIWDDIASKKIYLTGNVGQHGQQEAYEGAYKLPNLMAYNETCAAIAMALWNHRMFLLTGESKYADMLERIVYNGFLAGVSLSGDKFFYPNPLECDLKFKSNHGSCERSPWFGCSCCPVNVVRFIPSIAGLVYAVRNDSLYVNLYVNSKSSVTLANGNKVQVDQETAYPADGAIRFTISPTKEDEKFSLRLRLPGWVQGRPMASDLYRYIDSRPANWTLSLNGTKIDNPQLENGYLVVDRQWKTGDVVELDLPMLTRRVLAHEAVEADRGRVAIERGPLVYCAEGADNSYDLLTTQIPDESSFVTENRPDLLGGVVTLHTNAKLEDGKDVPLVLIPYYAWCNRGANLMEVWFKR